LPLLNVSKCLEPVTVLAAPWNAIFIPPAPLKGNLNSIYPAA
jgi:hypothetical protein